MPILSFKVINLKEKIVFREIAKFKINKGQEEEFATAALSCRPLFESARGCRSFSIERCVETSCIFYLLIEWEAVEDHTVHFRQSPAFAEWRERVGKYFAEPPSVIHTRLSPDNWSA